ncbi:MAG: hypothetical protein IT355_03775 [Gemmatimonadaceae bacterium]|nr:hypothetical protein [Gemmatimonadaceae bacterium]
MRLILRVLPAVLVPVLLLGQQPLEPRLTPSVARDAMPSPPAGSAPRVGLYDSVAVVLKRDWPDSGVRRGIVEPVLQEHAAAAAAAQTFGDEVAVVKAMLAVIPASHLGLSSATAYRTLDRALRGEREEMFGMQLLRWQGRWYATMVLNDGPAHRAGIRAWDEVVRVNGFVPDSSPVLDYSTDDAFLPDSIDPPVHPLRVDLVNECRFTVRVSRDSIADVTVVAERYSALEATQSSVEVIEADGLRVGYVHLWYMHFRLHDWLNRLLSGPLAGIDALVLDLRGRGGDGGLATSMVETLTPGSHQRYRGTVVLLQDRQTRSAKEMLADGLRARGVARIVGEASAGAVLPSGERRVGHGMMLMLPQKPSWGTYQRLELRRLEPDVRVSWAGPLGGATDPIFEAGLAEARRIVASEGRGVVVPPPPPLVPRQEAAGVRQDVERKTLQLPSKP